MVSSKNSRIACCALRRGLLRTGWQGGSFAYQQVKRGGGAELGPTSAFPTDSPLSRRPHKKVVERPIGDGADQFLLQKRPNSSSSSHRPPELRLRTGSEAAFRQI